MPRGPSLRNDSGGEGIPTTSRFEIWPWSVCAPASPTPPAQPAAAAPPAAAAARPPRPPAAPTTRGVPRPHGLHALPPGPSSPAGPAPAARGASDTPAAHPGVPYARGGHARRQPRRAAAAAGVAHPK